MKVNNIYVKNIKSITHDPAHKDECDIIIEGIIYANDIITATPVITSADPNDMIVNGSLYCEDVIYRGN